MTTVANLVDQVLRRSRTLFRDRVDFLGASMTTAATTLTVVQATTADTRVVTGDVIEIGSEMMLISASSSSPTWSVVNGRGWDGSTATTHSTGDTIRISPRFSRNQVSEALRETVDSWQNLWWADSFVESANMQSVDNRGLQLLQVPEDTLTILDVFYQADNNGPWTNPLSYDARNIGGDWWLNLPLPFYSPAPYGARDLVIHVARPFQTEVWNESTNLEEVVMLPRSMHDVAKWGALAKLCLAEEIPRASQFQRGTAADTEELPPGYIQQMALTFEGAHNRRRDEEAMKLFRAYGVA